MPLNGIKKREKLIKANKELIREFSDYAKKLSSSVSKSEDRVSAILKEIFSNAVEPSEKELSNARKRKELGNPPGKKGGLVGDRNYMIS